MAVPGSLLYVCLGVGITVNARVKAVVISGKEAVLCRVSLEIPVTDQAVAVEDTLHLICVTDDTAGLQQSS